MRSWCTNFAVVWTAVPVAALVLTGCASPYVNQHIEAVNAEYRALEAYSYEVERENDRLCDELQTAKDEITRLRGGSPPARRAGPFSAPLRSNNRITPMSDAPTTDPDAPKIEFDVPSTSAPPASPPPSLPPPSLPPIPRTPMRSGSSTNSSPPRSSVSSQKPADTPNLQLLPSAPKPPRPILEDAPPEPTINALPAGELPPPLTAPQGVEPEPVDGKVTHLFLNPLLTRGANLDSNPGDDGLAVVLEPRNRAGQYVPHAGSVTIVVLDPTKKDDAARVAKWTLDEKLVRQRISRSNGTRGIHLQLPWSGAAPEASQVKLFVRYQTDDGRQVEAQHDVILNPAAVASQRWTPRSNDKPRANVPAQPLVNTPATPPASVSAANPPLPTPVQSDLTVAPPKPEVKPAVKPADPNSLIREPAAPQTDIAKQPATAGNNASSPNSPSLLSPPPPSNRPEWKPFR